MNINLLKQICVLSLFLGAVLGILTLIPIINQISFWVLMCFAATCIMLFMIKFELLEIKSVQESAVLGAIIGFVSFIGFSLTYIPVTVILAKLFQVYTNYGVAVSLINASFGVTVVLVIFMGILSATVNAFSGFLTYYGIDFYKLLYKKDIENSKFEVKDNDRI